MDIVTENIPPGSILLKADGNQQPGRKTIRKLTADEQLSTRQIALLVDGLSEVSTRGSNGRRWNSVIPLYRGFSVGKKRGRREME